MTTNNFVRGVGRLVTDRYDFQDHVDGYRFNHNANSITLMPSLTIGGVPQTTVQGALTAALPYLVPPTLPDASLSTKGIVQLSRDIAGTGGGGSTATNVIVCGLQGNPVSSTSPTSGQVLTWNGSGYWEPAIIPNQFYASNDLRGTSSSQDVVAASGLTDIFKIKCSKINFISSLSPILTQDDKTSGSGNTLAIIGQVATAGVGGNVVISGGSGSTRTGSSSLAVDGGSTKLVEAAQPIANKSVLALLGGTSITSTQMPANTGNKVIYVANTSTRPTSGSPVGGCILYSYAGDLWVKQSNSVHFKINDENRYYYTSQSTAGLDWHEMDGWTTPFFETTNSTEYQDAFPTASYYQAGDGDIIKVTFSGYVAHESGGSGFMCLMLVGQGTGNVVIPGTELYIDYGTTDATHLSMTGRLTWTEGSDNVYATVGLYSNSSGTIALYGGATILIEVIRPVPIY